RQHLRPQVGHRREAGHPRRRVMVVEDRRDAGKALRPEHLLGIEGTVRLPEPCVSLARDLAHSNVARHLSTSYSTTRFSSTPSRSISSRTTSPGWSQG